ncbi:hypothetical protein MASR2M78_10750 [Treponema sp.]
MNTLYGLVLAGGKSSRMGLAKESFVYHDGISETRRIFGLLEELTSKAFYSVRPDQASLPLFSNGERIVDSAPDQGPLGALASAFAHEPLASWLLVPIDMPLLERQDLERLINARRKGYGIVAFVNEESSFEPLPAIYEGSLAEKAKSQLALGRGALRALGDGIECVFLKNDRQNSLKNINTAQERIWAMEALRG